MRPSHTPVSSPFAPRPRAAGPVLEVDGWRLKSYGIARDGRIVLPRHEDEVVAMAGGVLPDPDPEGGRPGVGWLILHRGADVDYAVLGWWDRENEMPVRVWVREDSGAWRGARDGESFCVWDLEIIAWERNAWVRHVLDGARGDVGAYLDDRAPAVRG